MRYKTGIGACLIALSGLVLLPLTARADRDLPVDNGSVTSGVGWRLDPFGSGRLVFHRGIDIAVPAGTPVRATRQGKVVLAGDDHHGHGNTIILEHDNGDRTLYGHNSLLRANVGDTVAAGEIIAFSGSSGRSTGPHVHYEKQPSGRPPVETAAVESVAGDKETSPGAIGKKQRDLLEQRLDASVDAVLKAIRSATPSGQGG